MTISTKVTYSTPCSTPAGVTCVDYNECPAPQPPLPPGILLIIISFFLPPPLVRTCSWYSSHYHLHRCDCLRLAHHHPCPKSSVGCPGCPVTGGAVLSPENQVSFSHCHLNNNLGDLRRNSHRWWQCLKRCSLLWHGDYTFPAGGIWGGLVEMLCYVVCIL